MRGAPILWAVPFTLFVASTALADVPNDPCMGLSAGDPCTTLDGQDGSCVDDGGFLTCQEPTTTTGTGGSGTTTGSGGTTTGSGGTSSSGDGGSTDSGGGDDDGGCTVSSVGADPTGAGGLLALLGLGLLVRRRRH